MVNSSLEGLDNLKLVEHTAHNACMHARVRTHPPSEKKFEFKKVAETESKRTSKKKEKGKEGTCKKAEWRRN